MTLHDLDFFSLKDKISKIVVLATERGKCRIALSAFLPLKFLT